MAVATAQTTGLPAKATSCDTSPTPSRRTVTALITSFAGLGLPRTLSIPIAANTPIWQLRQAILARLPPSAPTEQLLITTSANKLVRATDEKDVSTLLANDHDNLLSLRLSARLCGGKGGFGSQLRAAGGRMSSKKSRNQQANPNGSNRNLDGRRLRTIDEAKRLAEYLATKPEMERKEKEERRKRWEAVVEAAEATEQAIKEGKMDSNQGRLDAEYVESKEEAEQKVRDAVQKSMRAQVELDRTGSESSASAAGDEDDDDDAGKDEASSASSDEETGGRTFFGWDEDDDVSDETSDEEGATHDTTAVDEVDAAYQGKGKARAV